ncbi:Piso0_000217 [Millerozyma farinosa CBS 7064]|uniref:Piso0_000217 protein n=1 Tax=Pichia sorbitophila (strain ATCC MYA-4447 / BCRC 22081 / CBS 7064 / NBRC 10061 / NRRL Y-12695) TaxID=559304 RepID=G8YUU6_PICSO|nr:Piso0_000217 [Millerozyma farinosa CBS 7064]
MSQSGSRRSSLKQESTSESVFSASSTMENMAVQPYTESATAQLMRTATAVSGATGRSATGYSLHEIYGDMDSADIEMRRSATRQSVLSHLAARTQRLEELESKREGICDDNLRIQDDTAHDSLNRSDDDSTLSVGDLEKQLPQNPQSGVDIRGETELAAVTDAGRDLQDIDPELVSWESEDDVNNPRNWCRSSKCFIVGFVSFYTLVSPMSSSIPSPAMDSISKEFGITSHVVSSLVVSIQILAWAVGPLIIAPLSENENFGRKIVLDVSVWMAFFFNLGCAFAQNTAQMIVFRFVGGLFGSTPINVGAGVIADLYDARHRNVALAGFSLAPVLGPVIAPVIAGFLVENMHWRWVFYVLCIFNGAVAVLGTLFYRETYAPKLLRDKTIALRKATGNYNLHTVYQITSSETTFWGNMRLTMTRPLKLLCTHPMIIGLGSFMAFAYGFMYLMIVTFPTIFGQDYGFSKGITGLMYVPMGVGFTLGVIFWTYMIDVVYHRLTARNGGEAKPEFRLPCLCLSGIGISIGLFWYGWSVQKKLHWIMPGLGSAIFAFSFIATFQTIQNYLIDMNPLTSASSVASAAVFRSLLGFGMPLAAQPLYQRLTYGWGNTMLGFIALVLGVPFPLFCYFKGESLRNWANRNLVVSSLQREKAQLQQLQTAKNH